MLMTDAVIFGRTVSSEQIYALMTRQHNSAMRALILTNKDISLGPLSMLHKENTQAPKLNLRLHKQPCCCSQFKDAVATLQSARRQIIYHTATLNMVYMLFTLMCLPPQ